MTLPNWTANDWVLVIGAVSTAIVAVSSKQVIQAWILLADWWMKAREARYARLALDAELDDKGYKAVIRKQDRQIREIKEELEHERNQNDALYEKYVELVQKLATVTEQCKHLKERLEELGG